jgi:hypothetical protein
VLLLLRHRRSDHFCKEKSHVIGQHIDNAQGHWSERGEAVLLLLRHRRSDHFCKEKSHVIGRDIDNAQGHWSEGREAVLLLLRHRRSGHFCKEKSLLIGQLIDNAQRHWSIMLVLCINRQLIGHLSSTDCLYWSPLQRRLHLVGQL